MEQPLMVAFSGEGCGEEELTWGQLHIWRAIQETGSSLAMGAVAALPEGTTVGQLAEDLRFYASRYESIRTRLRLCPDGTVRQVVSASGEIPLSILDSDEPERLAGEIAARDLDTPFDYEHEWPMRMAVVRHRGAPTHLVATLCHLAADAMGVRVMMDELAARDPATGRPAGPVTGMTPRQLARLQRTPAMVRQNEAALRHWEGQLRAVPAGRFPGSATPRQPACWEVGFRSPALHLAVTRFAAMNGVDTPPVLLAAFAVALARVTGVNPVVTKIVVSNRFRPGLADVVAPVSQDGLFTVDVADLDFADLVTRTRSRAMSSYKYAYYDPRRMADLRARVARERGCPDGIDLGCIVNDRRMPTGAPDSAGAPPSMEQIREAATRTELRWVRPLPWFSERLMVHFNDVPSTVDITAQVDTRHLAPEDLEAFLHGMEEAAVRAVDPQTQRVTST